MCLYRQRVIANRLARQQALCNRRKKQGGTCSQRVPSRTLSLFTVSHNAVVNGANSCSVQR